MKTTINSHKKIPTWRAVANQSTQKKPLSSNMAHTLSLAAFQGNTAMTQAAQLQNQITQSPRLAAQKKRLTRLFGTNPNTTQGKIPGRPIQRLENKDLDKSGLKRKKTLSKKYGNALGVMSSLYEYAEEGFDYYFEQVTSLDELEILIDAAIEKATKKREAAESKETTEKEEIPIESLLASSTAPIISTPKKTAPKKKKRNRKKKRGKDITADFFTGGPSTVQEAVYSPSTVTNTLLQTWIGSKPGGAICTFDGIYVSDDTVYIYATIDIRDPSVTDFPLWNRYKVETHYHPVPESENYLHVKGRSGGSTQNVLTANNWLIPGGRATLRQGVQDWDSKYPLNKSPHTSW